MEKNIRDGAKISLLGDPDEEESKLWTELSSERVLREVEASLAALHILTSQNIPNHANIEDAIERIVQLARFQLQHSIYPAYDTVYRTDTKKNVTSSGGRSRFSSHCYSITSRAAPSASQLCFTPVTFTSLRGIWMRRGELPPTRNLTIIRMKNLNNRSSHKSTVRALRRKGKRRTISSVYNHPTLHAIKENLGMSGYVEGSSKQSLVEKNIEFKQLMLRIHPAVDEEKEKLASTMRAYKVMGSPTTCSDVPMGATLPQPGQLFGTTPFQISGGLTLGRDPDFRV